MLIDLSELLSHEDKVLNLSADLEMEHFETRLFDYPIADKKPIQFQISGTGDKKVEKHKLKMVGLKEGLLFKQNVASPNSPLNQLNEAYFYGFENNYGVLIQRIIGYAETDGAREGLYQVSPVGIAVKPSKIMEFKGTDIATIRERLLPDERDFVFKECEKGLGKSIRKDIGFNFQEMSKDDIKVLLKTIKGLPERTPKKEVTDRGLNSDLMKEDDIEIE